MIEKVVLNDREYWQASVGDKSRLFDMDKLDDAHDWACEQLRVLAEVDLPVPAEKLRESTSPKPNQGHKPKRR